VAQEVVGSNPIIRPMKRNTTLSLWTRFLFWLVSLLVVSSVTKMFVILYVTQRSFYAKQNSEVF
jgi:hypothetical protein